jgi:NAD(P) transhydrogenase subunit beta
VARAQRVARERAKKRRHRAITVRFAIHPVAGRMTGHINLLHAEAEVPFGQVFERVDINSEFGRVDVTIILGANDVLIPAAHAKGSAITACRSSKPAGPGR